MVSIKDLPKEEVLLALWHGSFAQGMAVLHEQEPTLEDCRRRLEQSKRVDYYNGHVIKVDLEGDEFNPDLYDRDCGPGAAYGVITKLRERIG